MAGGPFYYDPGVQSRGGEYIAAGIEQAGAGIAEGIQQLAARHKEMKGYQAIAEAKEQDPTSTFYQKDTSKLGLNDLKKGILKDETLQQIRVQQQQVKARAALGKFVQTIGAKMQPTPDYAAALNQGRGPIADIPQRPALKPGEALMQSFSENPEVINDPETAGEAMDFGKMISTVQPKVPTNLGTDEGSGRGMWLDPSGRLQFGPAPMNPLARLTGNQPPTNVQLPDDQEWVRGATGWAMRTKGQANKGLLPPGSKTVTEDGVIYAETPDGWRKPLGKQGQAVTIDADGTVHMGGGGAGTDTKGSADPDDPLNLGLK